MVDFGKLVHKKQSKDSKNLINLFESFDRKTSHTELRKPQTEILIKMTNDWKDKDKVLKFSTGSGKTTVGLVYLQSYMEIEKRPVLYLCPTTQLVRQVLSESQKIGLKTCHYEGGEPFPPLEGTAAKSIIISTYLLVAK